MPPDELRETILAALTEVAPNVDAVSLDDRAHFRDQFDFDSVDQLNFVLALERRLAIHVPELDYPRLASVDSSLAFLREGLQTQPER